MATALSGHAPMETMPTPTRWRARRAPRPRGHDPTNSARGWPGHSEAVPRLNRHRGFGLRLQPRPPGLGGSNLESGRIILNR
jgi:hypothetical protein